MLTLGHRRPDQYYWLTSLMSERHSDAERSACTLVAVVMATLAALPVALLFTPVGPTGGFRTTLTIVIALWTLVLAALWARRHWPTRVESKVFSGTVVLCTAISAVNIVDPVAALLGAVAFAVFGFYIAFFHSTGYTAFNLAVAAITTAVLAERLSHNLGVVAAVCGFVFVMMINLTAPLVCFTALRFVGIDLINRDIDVFTGLITTAALERRVGELTGARARYSDEHLVVTAVVMDDLELLAATASRASQERAQVAIAQTLRTCTRSSAALTHWDHNVFVIADVFAADNLSAYCQRVLGALSTTPPRMSFSVGIVRTPLAGLATCSPGQLLDQLVEAADTAAQQARQTCSDRTCLSVVTLPGIRCDTNDGDDHTG